jgi:4-hydroxybenzoate polyprenyltransferase
VLFVPILFSIEIFQITNLTNVFLGFVIFCLTSSGVYMLNDIFDYEKDRKHPVKKNRPISSGKLSVKTALTLSMLYFIISFVSSFFLDRVFSATILVYILINMLYSVFLKKIVIIDVIVISFGFLLRAYAGLVLAQLPFSEWFILSVYFISVFLTVQKRKAEIINKHESRGVMKKYTVEMLNQYGSTFMALIILAYSFYTFQKASSKLMIITIPQVIYALFRYNYLTETYGFGERTQDILKDKPSLINMIIYIALTAGILLLS